MLKFGSTLFGSVFCATGARGFYGEGYPFHKFSRLAGMNWEGSGFSAKTMTLLHCPGNMPLKNNGVTPREFYPRCIWVNLRTGEMMNAVGLSNFGMDFYLKLGHYQEITKPFSLSFMLRAEDASGREAEVREICRRLKPYLKSFRAPVMVHWNFGCPNSGHNLQEFYGEICSLMEIARAELGGTPILINTNALMPTPVFQEAARIVDGFVIGNTIPYKSTDQIDWSRYGDTSPIRRRGIQADGGLSSPKCLPLTIAKVQELRDSGIYKPIIAGNGIRTRSDVDTLFVAGADAIFVGSLAVVRPYALSAIIDYARLTL